MTNLRSTVVMKTDVRDSTARMGTLIESDLSTFLQEHKRLIVDLIAQYGGQRVKGEGDSFWVIFPAVTSAALAAIAIQKDLRLSQIGKDEKSRLAVRIMITLGDVLHQENDIFGEAVNLAARMDSVTPADEIYLSAAAWLALNKAEVQTAYVDTILFKGIAEPVAVYRVEYHHQTRILRDQILVMSDLRGATRYIESVTLAEVERVLSTLQEIHNRACEASRGIVRYLAGDTYLLTFSSSEHALAAVDQVLIEWAAFRQVVECPCSINIGVSKGDFYAFRSYFFGTAIRNVSRITALGRVFFDGSGALISVPVGEDLAETPWATRLERTTVPVGEAETGIGEVYKLSFASSR